MGVGFGMLACGSSEADAPDRRRDEESAIEVDITVRRSGRKASTYRYNDRDMTAEELSAESGIPVAVLRARLQKGWDIGRALSTKVGCCKIAGKIGKRRSPWRRLLPRLPALRPSTAN